MLGMFIIHIICLSVMLVDLNLLIVKSISTSGQGSKDEESVLKKSQRNAVLWSYFGFSKSERCRVACTVNCVKT